MTNDIAIPLSPFLCPKNMRKEVRRASGHVFEKRVQRQLYISGSFEIKNLEGEGPPEPVRLRTTEMVANLGSGFPIRLRSSVSINEIFTEH